MKIEYTISLWQIILFVAPFIVGAIRFYYKQQEQGKSIEDLKAENIKLEKKMSDHEKEVDLKHDHIHEELKKLDTRFTDQRLVLQDIKTTMELLLNQKLRLNASH